MVARRLRLTTLVWLCAVTCLLTVGGGVAVALPSQFGSEGEGAGQFHSTRNIAVDQGNGDVYIADSENNERVEKFTAEGAFLLAWGWGVADGVTEALQTCTATCHKGFGGSGAGEINDPGGIAVDNDPLSASYEDLYVYNEGDKTIEKFGSSGAFLLAFSVGSGREHPIAVDASGNVFAGGEEAIEEFSSTGTPIATIPVAQREDYSLVVDSSDNLYVAGNPVKGIDEYSASGALIDTLDATGNPVYTTLDSAGDMFVDDQEPGENHVIEYNSTGAELTSFEYGEPESGYEGLVWSDTVQRLYQGYRFDESHVVNVVSVPPPGPILIGSESVSGTEPTSATLNVTVNPEGNSTKYRFEYGPTTSYGSSAPVGEGSIAAGFDGEAVTAELSKLRAGVSYHYRLVATDSEDHVLTGPDATFSTLPAVSIDDQSVSGVSSTSVTFDATLNPLGVEASYWIEYGTSASYGTSLPEAPIGSGSNDVTVSEHVQGLLANTVYHYRVVARDVREGVAYVVEGADRTFTTQGGAGALKLLDGRAWEEVSPADKNGASFAGLGSTYEPLVQASAAGDAFTYVASHPTEIAPAGITIAEQVLSKHGVDGWSSQDINPPHDTPTGLVIQEEEYAFFSEDLSRLLVEQHEPSSSFTAASPLASEPTLYVRQQNVCEADPSSSECFLPLVTGKEGYSDVPPNTVFGPAGLKSSKSGEKGLGLEGATSDLSHVIFTGQDSDPLTSTAAPVGSLYEWSADKPPASRLQVVSVLPAGEGGGAVSAYLGGKGPQGREADSRHAISADGSRVFWSPVGVQEPGLYVRDIAKGETLRIDVPEQGVTAKGSEQSHTIFQSATSDGSEVFFTDTQRLTPDSGARLKTGGEQEPDLYECIIVEDVGALKCDLTDLTPETGGERASVQGTLPAVAADGAYIYFVADGVLSPGATPGECHEESGVLDAEGATCNLYVLHDGKTTFIATLSKDDRQDWSGNVANVRELMSRVSPNGRYFSFFSDRSLTGYDNLDARSGKPDQEMYLYDAATNHLVCASCNPSGARPLGVESDDGGGPQLVQTYFHAGEWFAATVPGWMGTDKNVSVDVDPYQTRYLSDEGRMFFDSSDALVPQDINGTMDVYEFEPEGVGDCGSSNPTFSEVSGGCVGLVSSGSSADESAFMDASETGNDVFFLTTEKLVPQDTDTAIDVYDAHVCTSEFPCSSQPSSPPPCETADACRAAPSPQPVVFGSPSSATFAGAGDVSQSPAQAVKAKSSPRAQKLAAALRACRKRYKTNRGKRAGCERQARKRYRVVSSRKVGTTRKGGR